jgi:carbamoyltransferase
MKVLGISALFHDAAAALVVDGEVVAAAQEERFSRIKHDARLPVDAARFCLEQGGLTMADIDHVVFYEKPLRKFERILVTHLREFPRSLMQFPRSMATWLRARLWQKGELCEALGCAPEQLLFSEHHLSHAASAFFASPFERAAVVTVDGVGEWATTSIYRAAPRAGGGTAIETLAELHFPHSIGLLYSAITAYLGFEVNDGEYKVMGLAAYGEPRYQRAFEQLCRVDDDAALHIEPKYFSYASHPTRSFTRALELLLGPARQPGAALTLPAVTVEDRRFADVAATLQWFTERYLLTLARRAQALTGERDLCMAGGVALNSVANGHIAAQGPFDGVFVQPAAGDAGGARGPLGDPRGARVAASSCACQRLPRGGLRPRGGRALSHRLRRAAHGVCQRRRAQRGRGRAARGGARRGLLPGALRVGAARARGPLDRGRPARPRDARAGQSQDQVPRALPPLRAGGAGRGGDPLVRDARQRERPPHAVDVLGGSCDR